jgi:hypothetical protein
MDAKTILADLRAERDRLNLAIAAIESLEGTTAPVKRGRPAKSAATTVPTVKKRTMSAAARKRIAEAQRKRWAAKRAAEKKPAAKTAKASGKKAATKETAPRKATKRVVSPEARQRMAKAQQKRWAKAKRAARAIVKKGASSVATAAAKEAPKA